jgi:hypothetical protein
MVHTFKRIYLYTAASFALLFSAVVTINLLTDLFRLAGLSYDFYIQQAPTDVKSDLLFFVVGVLLVGVAFGGVHYWLIRRDARSDPGALGGATRHIFLNGLLAVSALIAVFAGLTALGEIGQTESDRASPLAWAVVFALVFLLVEWERRKVLPVGRAATLIRKIHENVLQGILLIVASFAIYYASKEVVEYVLVQNGTLQVIDCSRPASTFSPTDICQAPLLIGPLAQALFASAAWALYVWLGFWDQRSVLRWVLRFVAFGVGIIWLLAGVESLVQTAVGGALGVPNAWLNAQLDDLPFIGQIVTGALIALPYFFWIRRVSAASLGTRQASDQGLLAVPAGLSAGLFLAGLSMVLAGLLEKFIPGGKPPSDESWALSLGLLVAGLGYLPSWWVLRRISDPARGGPVLPRRVYVLALLAGTAIAAVGFAVTAIYQFLKVFLGIAGGDDLLARQALVVVVVVGATALYHVWQLRADLRVLHARQTAAQPAPAPTAEDGAAPVSPPVEAGLASEAVPLQSPTGAGETLESILSAVAAGTLAPAAAAARIRALPRL